MVIVKRKSHAESQGKCESQIGFGAECFSAGGAILKNREHRACRFSQVSRKAVTSFTRTLEVRTAIAKEESQ